MADIEKMATSEAWKQALADRGWVDRYLAGDAFQAQLAADIEATSSDPERHRPRAMSGHRGRRRRAAPTGRRWSSRSLLAVLAAVIFWETRAMPVAAAYARVGPTTFPYVIAAGLALLAVGTAVSGLARRLPGARGGPRRPDALDHRRAGRADAAAQDRRASRSPPALLFALTARGFGRGPLWLTLPIGVAFALRRLARSSRGSCSCRCRPGRSSSWSPDGGAHGHLRAARQRPRCSRCSRSTSSTR